MKEGDTMAQEQREIELILSNSQRRKASATGNNAAWNCECKRTLPLIGRTGALEGPSDAVIVECPNCHRRYSVVPRDKNQGAAVEVREIAEKG